MSLAGNQESRRKLEIVTVSVDTRDAACLREIVDSLPGFELTGEVDQSGANDAAVMQDLEQRRPDVCVLDFDNNWGGAAWRAEQIKKAMPQTAVFALASESRPELIIDAMRSGCSEYLLKPPSRERVVEALVKQEQKRRERRAPTRKGKIYAFLGVKGGTGVTTLTTHLAAFAAQRGIRTLLIDQHPDLGDVSVYLGLGKHQYNFFELVHNIHRLDNELLQGFVLKHSSGLHVLAAPDSFGSATPKSSETALESTLDFLRQEYELVIIDCPPELNAYNLGAIARADAVFLIAAPELPSIRNMVRYLEHLKHFSCPMEKLKIVINRYDTHTEIRDDQIEKTIRMPISYLVPNSYAEVIGAINAGTPIALNAKSALGGVFRRWIDTLVERTGESQVKPEPLWIGITGLVSSVRKVWHGAIRARSTVQHDGSRYLGKK